jgi:hypothetical protein
MHNKASIVLDLRRVAAVIVDAMPVEGQGGIEEG